MKSSQLALILFGCAITLTLAHPLEESESHSRIARSPDDDVNDVVVPAQQGRRLTGGKPTPADEGGSHKPKKNKLTSGLQSGFDKQFEKSRKEGDEIHDQGHKTEKEGDTNSAKMEKTRKEENEKMNRDIEHAQDEALKSADDNMDDGDHDVKQGSKSFKGGKPAKVIDQSDEN